MRTTRMLAPVALAVTLALAGCTGDRAGFDGPGGTDGAPSDDAATQEGAGGDPGARVDGIDPDDVIVSYEVDGLPAGAPGGSSVTVGIHSLEVQGDVMLLELYYTPTLGGGDPNEKWDLYAMNDRDPLQPLLIDRPNLTQYSVIRETPNSPTTWSLDVVGTGTTDGGTLMWWGYYAAPPEGVDSISIQVHPEHPVVDDVPIQR